MKHSDWSVLLCLLGAIAAAAAAFLALPPTPMLLLAAALFAVLAVLSISHRNKLNQLQKRCDEMCEQMNRELEAHEQAMDALREEQEHARSAFFSEISHSLRMPISVIQGYAELMQKGAVDPVRESEYLDRIVHHTHRMIDVLSKKLDPDTEDSGITPARKQVDLVPLVRDQLQDLQRTASERGVSLQMVCPDDSLRVYADKRLLQRIFFNLVENSIHYMGRDGIVTVRLSRADDMARIIVSDDGLGLPESEVSSVFNAHFRGSNTKPGSGSGYGLFLVKQAVEAQGGSISASSRPGRGMSVTFTLPMAQDEAAEV